MVAYDVDVAVLISPGTVIGTRPNANFMLHFDFTIRLSMRANSRYARIVFLLYLVIIILLILVVAISFFAIVSVAFSVPEFFIVVFCPDNFVVYIF